MEGTTDYVGKKPKGRQLIRHRPTKGMLSRSSVIERLEKLATKIDNLGMHNMANKLDYILHKIG